jgi:hypothetical protein
LWLVVAVVVAVGLALAEALEDLELAQVYLLHQIKIIQLP